MFTVAGNINLSPIELYFKIKLAHLAISFSADFTRIRFAGIRMNKHLDVPAEIFINQFFYRINFVVGVPYF